MKKLLVLQLVLFFFCTKPLLSQNIESYQFMAFGALPTWSAVAVDWQTKPKLYVYDPKETRGHAEFVNKKLGRLITFKQFKELASTSAQRQYLPFFIYDLKDKPLMVQGKSYTYAVRLEDYEFDDTPKAMANEVEKLMKLMPTLAKRFGNDGLVVINLRPNDALNINAIGSFLKAKKLEMVSTTTLIKHIGGTKFKILHEVPAVGKLVLVKSEADANQLTAHDIAIFQFMPKRIPTLAGIITLEAQTPLSHINLLAINRNTFNMYLTDWSVLPELKNNLNKLVEINPKFQKLTIKPVTQEYATKFWTKNKPPQLTIPTPKATFESVVPLSKTFKQYQQVELIGAKANNYALLYELLGDKMVHPAYAIGFKPYLDLLEQGANKEINFFLSKRKMLSTAKRQQALARIRAVIEKSIPSATTIASLRNILNTHFTNGRVKLRSSTNCEDLPQFNGAGLYESKGFNTKDNDALLAKKITKVYASLWNDVAFEEREYFGIDHKKVAMAILISPAFVDEFANGVILATTTPKSANLSILVNAQVGENEVTNPKKGDIPEAFAVGKTTIEKVLTPSNLGKVFIGNTATQALLKLLRESTEKIHKALSQRQINQGDNQKYSTDIEFKLVKDTNNQYGLYFKQARLLRSNILPE
jgi:hypothetical protein